MMTTPECPRTTLVEALRDGRLGPQDNASMERHLESCAKCAEYARDLSQIGEAIRAPLEKLTPLEHQRARVALLQRAATQSPTRAIAMGPRWAFATVLLAAAIVLGFFSGRLDQPTQSVAIALHTPGLPKIARGTNIDLRPSDDARFSRNHTSETDELMLDHGSLNVKLGKVDHAKRFVVRTKDAQIVVQATAFRVEAKDGKIRSVAVEEGSVEVQYAGFTGIITAGGSWTATDNAPDAAKPAPTPAPDSLIAPSLGDGSPAHTDVPQVAQRKTIAQSPTVQKMERPEQPTAVPTIAPTAQTAPDKPPSVVAPTATTPSPSPASRTFADAMAAMRRGDYGASAEQLEQFAKTHAGDARADEADYLLAIALQRAGRRTEAIAAAKRYLATRPNGAHRADAARIAGN